LLRVAVTPNACDATGEAESVAVTALVMGRATTTRSVSAPRPN
jgi:hypothetical protein